jgi:hypothetical protein
MLMWYLGDYAPGYTYHGPIERTIDAIPPVDLFLCCETLEHLDEPEAVLKAIRYKTNKLLISTPICTFIDDNPEHYWAWDQEAVVGMLRYAGFEPILYRDTFYDPGYCFQIWGCI